MRQPLLTAKLELEQENKALRAQVDDLDTRVIVSEACCKVLAERFAPDATWVDLPDIIGAQIVERDAQNARLREALEKVLRLSMPSDVSGYAWVKEARAALAESPAAALDALKREVAKRVREACVEECACRAVLNDSVEGVKDMATDPQTGVVGSAPCHRAIEARECAFALSALDLSALLAEARHEA